MASNVAPSLHRWLLIGISACLLVLWGLRITDEPIDKDAGQNLRLAINLAHHGIVSEDLRPPYRTSMTREPLPVFENAALIVVGDWVLGRPANDNVYFFGERARLIKFQNLIWMSLLVVVLFLAARQFTSSVSLAWAGVVLFQLVLLSHDNSRYLIDSLYTEAPSAALLMLGSLLLVNGMFRGGWFVVAAGVVFGLLALVKAVFLYVFVGVIFVSILAVALRWIPGSMLEALRKILTMSLFFGLVAVPWMLRNYQAHGLFAITERGGEVLYTRAIKDRMSAVEIRGASCYWARWPTGAVLKRIFGFTAKDLELGGRLQRLNRAANSSFAANDLAATATGRPDLAISYYRQATAEKMRLRLEFQQQGRQDYEIDAGRALQKKALKMIKERPVRHLFMTPLFIWRGAFYTFPILAVVLVLAIRKRQFEQVLFMMPAFGTVVFYGFFSHYIPRYSLPITPVTTVGILILMTLLIKKSRFEEVFRLNAVAR